MVSPRLAELWSMLKVGSRAMLNIDNSKVFGMAETVADYTVGYPMAGMERATDYIVGGVFKGIGTVGGGVAKMGTSLSASALSDSGTIAKHVYNRKFAYGAAIGAGAIGVELQNSAPDVAMANPIQVHKMSSTAASNIGFSNHALNSYYAR